MSSRSKNALRILGLLVVLGLILWASHNAIGSTYVSRIIAKHGYVGIFSISVVSGFNLVLPIPIIAFMPLFIQAGLHFWMSIFLISVGMTLGDGLGFYLGTTGKDLFVLGNERSGVVEKIKRVERLGTPFPYALLFLYASFVPAPNELIVIPMAFLGYRIRYIMPIVLVGNTMFNILIGLGLISFV